MMPNSHPRIVTLIIFAIAMGFMESAVVVYLREIYYPNGFDFPLSAIDGHVALTEILREAATLVMLITIGIITGRTKTERFAFFILSFAIWDIFYYIFLYLLLGWPSSLLTWDILFLIPTIWVGPVLGPVLNSFSMILLALLISKFTSSNPETFVSFREWLLLIIGSIILIISYTEDFVEFMLNKFRFTEIFNPAQTDELMEYASSYIPVSFAWWIFLIGQGLILAGIGVFYRRNIKQSA